MRPLFNFILLGAFTLTPYYIRGKGLLRRFWLLGIFVFAAGCGQAPRETKPFPSGPVTLICPPKAGGISDLVTRTLASAAEKELGVPVNVVNKPGGSGGVGMSFGSRAKPDGYTLTYVVVEIAILPHLGLVDVKEGDFDLLFRTNYNPAALTVQANAPWKNISEFIDAAKKNPGGIKIGNSGTASIWHLAAASLGKETGAAFNHIPFDGAAGAVTALLGGHVDAVTVSPTEVQSQVEAGKLTILGLMSEKRDALFPEVPTLKELGFDVSVGAWGGLAVPIGTPDAVRKKLTDAFLKSFKTQTFQDVMAKRGVTPAWLDAQPFQEFARSQSTYFGNLIQALGIKP